MQRTKDMLVAETPEEAVLLLVAQARIELESRGYTTAQIADAMISQGIAAASDAHGFRSTAQQLYLLALQARAAAEDEDEAKKDSH